MQVSGFFPIFALGVLGGVLIELLRWFKLRENADFPDYAASPRYWILTVLMIVGGGFLAVLYGLDPRNALMAVNLGASAPALIGAMAAPPQNERPSTVPGGGTRRTAVETPGQMERRDSVRSFLSFGA